MTHPCPVSEAFLEAQVQYFEDLSPALYDHEIQAFEELRARAAIAGGDHSLHLVRGFFCAELVHYLIGRSARYGGDIQNISGIDEVHPPLELSWEGLGAALTKAVEFDEQLVAENMEIDLTPRKATPMMSYQRKQLQELHELLMKYANVLRAVRASVRGTQHDLWKAGLNSSLTIGMLYRTGGVVERLTWSEALLMTNKEEMVLPWKQKSDCRA